MAGMTCNKSGFRLTKGLIYQEPTPHVTKADHCTLVGPAKHRAGALTGRMPTVLGLQSSDHFEFDLCKPLTALGLRPCHILALRRAWYLRLYYWCVVLVQ